MHTPDRENDPWDTAMPAEIWQDLVDYAQPPAATRPTPDAGLLQQLPSTFGEIFDHLYDTAYNPREWQMPPILAEIDRSMREAGKAAAGGIAEFNARAAEGARSLARTRLQQEMQGALARGDRKTYKRKLAELRKITPERNDR